MNRRASIVLVTLLGAWSLPVASAREPLQTASDPVRARDEASPERPDFYAAEDELRGYVLEALEKSPSVMEMRARYRAALESVPRVGGLPDPVFTFTQAIRSVETRVGPQRNVFALSQAFPWFGELDLREQVQTQEALAALEMTEATEREVIARVKRAYYELAYVERALALTLEEQSLLEHYEVLAEARYASGQGLQQAVIKLQSEITRTRSRLDLLEQQRRSLQARLNTLMDRPAQGPVSAGGASRALPEIELDIEALYALGDENRQELRAAEERIKKEERSVDLARKTAWPDFVVGFGFVNVGPRGDAAGIDNPPPDNGKNAVSVSAGISLPIWREKYDASVRAASEMLLAERSRYADARNEMEFSIRDQAVRIETLDEQIRLFESVLIPQAEQTLLATEAAYETGQLGVLDLLDSERVLLNARLVNARYYADLSSALASLERAVGTRFPRSTMGEEP